MIDFDVRIIADEDLPAEHDYCFLRLPGHLVFAVKASRAQSPWVLREAWIVSRDLRESGPHLLAGAS